MREQIDFSGRVAVVTGAASGIGTGVAKELAKEGADIAVADIDEEGGEAVAAEIREEYDRDARFVYTDISDYERCGEAVDEVVDHFGRIDVLANVAAGGLSDMDGMVKPFDEETPENWVPHLEITLPGPIHMTHQVVPVMKENGGGAVVNFASDSYQGQDPNLTVYAAAKAGVVTFTKSVAKELGEYNIRVNCISPSTTWSGSTQEWLDEHGEKVAAQYPLGRLGEPQDHANAVVFLASDAADWITGQVLSVNGGFI
jgi:NAD(P)-dependent dehydrogenase (short-subunit alcohol dehydrogenase family)